MVRVSHLICCLLVTLGLFAVAAPARAAQSPFDLVGPDIHVAVTRDGRTLPIEWVPNLAAGDRLSIKLGLPDGQRARYRLIVAFLSGATDRPPEDWFHDAKTWKDDGSDLSLIVPEGAQQAVLLLMPEDGGDVDAVVDTVRKRPGTFVRAAQELNQASLDRARLDAFLRHIQHIERENPESLADASQMLTRSLSVKLDMNCLQQPAALQAACLADGREAMLLADTHSSALVSTLTGAPTDLAFQLSATPQGGYGYYSPYIGVVRDIFRIFGAFQSTQLQYIPALARMGGDRVTLLLNAPLSFGKPLSVMVTGLPAIEAPTPPPLRRAGPESALCAASDLVLPVEGAPLIYATGYARNLVFRLTRSDGSVVEVPVRADAERGGLVPAGPIPTAGFGATINGRVHGDWGFTTFDGPQFTLVNPAADGWAVAADASAVAGRENNLRLTGGSAGCVSRVEWHRAGGGARPIEWKPAGRDAIVATLPLEAASAGQATLLIHRSGAATPQPVPVRIVEEAARIDALTLHAGDTRAVLAGTRLDQVREVRIGDALFRPGEITRVEQGDRLLLTAAEPAAAAKMAAGRSLSAEIAFADGRDRSFPVTVAPPRARVELLRISDQFAPADARLPITFNRDDMAAQGARLTFAFHTMGEAGLTGRETVEVATDDGSATARLTAGKGYMLQDRRTGIVTFTPADALGPLAYGPLKFRIVRDGVASDWVDLATVVRLPTIRAVDCTAGTCQLSGDQLFLIDAIAANAGFADAVALPDGFTAARIAVPAPADGKLFLRLRDAPSAIATVTVR